MTINDDVRKMLHDEMIESERHVDDPAPEDGKYTRPGREAAKVYSLRLTPSTVAQLEQLAEQTGATASAIIRGFIDDGLAAREHQDLASAIDRLDADLRLLRAVAR